jgi:aldehyde dehydrogenase (NAD+)
MALNFIDNQWQPAASGLTLPMIDPATGQPFETIARSGAADVDQAVRSARQAQDRVWGRTPAAERGRLLMALSRAVASHADELAALEQRDCGKPTKQAAADALALARYFEFYAGACDKLHGETIPYQDGYSVLHLARATRRDRPRHSLELPDADLRAQRGRRTGCGQRCVVKPSEDACLSLAFAWRNWRPRSGFPAGVPSTSSPATATKWAMRWRATRALTTSASPAARAWAR